MVDGRALNDEIMPFPLPTLSVRHGHGLFKTFAQDSVGLRERAWEVRVGKRPMSTSHSTRT